MKREKEKILPDKPKEDKREKKLHKAEKEEPEDKKETKKLLMALGVIAVICISFLVWFYYSKNKPIEFPSYEYNGFTFTKIEGLWHTEWQRGNELFSVHLRYGPKESENIPIIRYSNETFKINKTVYITFDPGTELGYIALASTEISLNLHNTFGIKPIAACTENKTQPCSKRPIITCTNTNESVIYIRKGDETGLFTNNNCLIIQGKDEDIVRAADKVIWVWYGIIK